MIIMPAGRMVQLNVEVLVLLLFLSPCLDQVSILLLVLGTFVVLLFSPQGDLMINIDRPCNALNFNR